MIRTFRRGIAALLVAGGATWATGGATWARGPEDSGVPEAAGVSGAPESSRVSGGPEAPGAAAPPVPGVPVPAPDPGFSLTVSPARLVVGPEEIGAGHSFHVINRGRSPVDVTVRRADVTTDRSGGTVFRRDAPAPRSAAGWLRVRPSRFRLVPGAERSVTVLIDPPARAESGGHRAALLFVVPAEDGDGDVLLNRAIGAPVYITVPGPVDTSARVSGLTASRTLTTGGPVDFTVTVDNLGTAHRDLSGKDRLKVRVNGEEVPFPDFTVPRGASGSATARWADPPPMCVCRATVSITGTGGTSRRSVVLVVLPPWPLVASPVSVPVLYVAVRLLRRRRRRRKTYEPVVSSRRDVRAWQMGEATIGIHPAGRGRPSHTETPRKRKVTDEGRGGDGNDPSASPHGAGRLRNHGRTWHHKRL